MIIRIVLCLSAFPEESLKIKSLREKESGLRGHWDCRLKNKEKFSLTESTGGTEIVIEPRKDAKGDPVKKF